MKPLQVIGGVFCFKGMINLALGANEIFITQSNATIASGNVVKVRLVEKEGKDGQAKDKTATCSKTAYNSFTSISLTVVASSGSEDLPNGSVFLEAGYEGIARILIDDVDTYQEQFRVI